jgi:hypothetical protein
MVSRGTANIHMGSIKCTFILLVIAALRLDARTLHSGGFVGTKELSHIDLSNLMASVNITVLNNAVAKGAGKCSVCRGGQSIF